MISFQKRRICLWKDSERNHTDGTSVSLLNRAKRSVQCSASHRNVIRVVIITAAPCWLFYSLIAWRKRLMHSKEISSETGWTCTEAGAVITETQNELSLGGTKIPGLAGSWTLKWLQQQPKLQTMNHMAEMQELKAPCSCSMRNNELKPLKHQMQNLSQ